MSPTQAGSFSYRRWQTVALTWAFPSPPCRREPSSGTLLQPFGLQNGCKVGELPSCLLRRTAASRLARRHPASRRRRFALRCRCSRDGERSTHPEGLVTAGVPDNPEYHPARGASVGGAGPFVGGPSTPTRSMSSIVQRCPDWCPQPWRRRFDSVPSAGSWFAATPAPRPKHIQPQVTQVVAPWDTRSTARPQQRSAVTCQSIRRRCAVAAPRRVATASPRWRGRAEVWRSNSPVRSHSRAPAGEPAGPHPRRPRPRC